MSDLCKNNEKSASKRVGVLQVSQDCVHHPRFFQRNVQLESDFLNVPHEEAAYQAYRAYCSELKTQVLDTVSKYIQETPIGPDERIVMDIVIRTEKISPPQ